MGCEGEGCHRSRPPVYSSRWLACTEVRQDLSRNPPMKWPQMLCRGLAPSTCSTSFQQMLVKARIPVRKKAGSRRKASGKGLNSVRWNDRMIKTLMDTLRQHSLEGKAAEGLPQLKMPICQDYKILPRLYNSLVHDQECRLPVHYFNFPAITQIIPNSPMFIFTV